MPNITDGEEPGKSNKLLYAILVIAAVIIAMIAWPIIFPPKPMTLRELLTTLSAEATTDMKDSNNRFRAPMFPVEAIGTLIKPETNGPAANDSGCLMTTAVAAKPTVNLFPDSFKVLRSAAISWDTTEAIAKILKSVKLTKTDSVELKFSDVRIAVLSDDDLRDLASSEQCQKALAGRSLWIVRGYVSAKRYFETGRQVGDTAEIPTKYGTFTIDGGSGQGTMTVSDNEPVPFLEIVSAVTIDRQTKAVTVSAPKVLTDQPNSPAVVPTKVTSVSTSKGRIFFQRGKGDESGNDVRLIAELKRDNLPVEPIVQEMKSEQLPKMASIRYYNDGDKAAAERIFQAVVKLYPTARLQRLPLTAPLGQMEVWLPLPADATTQPAL